MMPRNRGHDICQGEKFLVIKENMVKRNCCGECPGQDSRRSAG
jgi:hypothetical protein